MLAQSDSSKCGSPAPPAGNRQAKKLCVPRQWQFDWHMDHGDIPGLAKVPITEGWLWSRAQGSNFPGSIWKWQKHSLVLRTAPGLLMSLKADGVWLNSLPVNLTKVLGGF